MARVEEVDEEEEEQVGAAAAPLESLHAQASPGAFCRPCRRLPCRASLPKDRHGALSAACAFVRACARACVCVVSAGAHVQACLCACTCAHACVRYVSAFSACTCACVRVSVCVLGRVWAGVCICLICVCVHTTLWVRACWRQITKHACFTGGLPVNMCTCVMVWVHE